eukprot:1074737_1
MVNKLVHSPPLMDSAIFMRLVPTVRLIYGIINTTYGPQVHAIYLSGYYAGFEATITCITGHTCNIYCHSADACTNLHLFCDNNCNIIKGELLTTTLSIHDILLYD